MLSLITPFARYDIRKTLKGIDYAFEMQFSSEIDFI